MVGLSSCVKTSIHPSSSRLLHETVWSTGTFFFGFWVAGAARRYYTKPVRTAVSRHFIDQYIHTITAADSGVAENSFFFAYLGFRLFYARPYQ